MVVQSDFYFGPLSYVLAYSDHIVVYVFTPVDHLNSNCQIFWLVHEDAEEGKDYDVEKLTWLVGHHDDRRQDDHRE